MFPFQWWIRGYDDEVFSEQISLKNIHYAISSNWERNPGPANSSFIMSATIFTSSFMMHSMTMGTRTP